MAQQDFPHWKFPFFPSVVTLVWRGGIPLLLWCTAILILPCPPHPRPLTARAPGCTARAQNPRPIAQGAHCMPRGTVPGNCCALIPALGDLTARRGGGGWGWQWNMGPPARNCSITDHGDHGVHLPASADRLHIQSFPDCEFWRVLSTTNDVGTAPPPPPFAPSMKQGRRCKRHSSSAFMANAPQLTSTAHWLYYTMTHQPCLEAFVH